jgi:hypothetical protein
LQQPAEGRCTKEADLEAAQRSATIRAARSDEVYYVIEINDTYQAVSAWDYYVKYQGVYEALYRVEIKDEGRVIR